jgi:pyruvate dehydrogenase E1 component beta subunit
VFRGPNGPAQCLGSQHSQAIAAIYAHIPGLKVVSPATPYDAKGLLKSAIRDDNPVVMMENELLYGTKGDVPTEEYLLPIGVADIKRPGTDITLITFGNVLSLALNAAGQLEEEGINAEVIDLRSLRPLDEETILNSVTKTGRCIVIDESWPVAGVGAYVAWLVSNKCFDLLDAQVELITSEDVPMPYNHQLELAVLPSTEKILAAVKKVLCKG